MQLQKFIAMKSSKPSLLTIHKVSKFYMDFHATYYIVIVLQPFTKLNWLAWDLFPLLSYFLFICYNYC